MFVSNTLRKSVLAVVIILITVIAWSISLKNVSASTTQITPEIQSLLSDYSDYLNAGETPHRESFSSAMTSLVQDRREYYQEYFTTALHSNLISSQFEFDLESNVAVVQKGNSYNVQIWEIVTLQGSPMIKQPEDYPLIQAAKWAIDQTSDPTVVTALEKYIDSWSTEISDSGINGFEMTFLIRHNLRIENNKGQLEIIRDEFTDKSGDDPEGIDNIVWANGGFIRNKPDFTQFPDYKFHNTPIEELGQQLLADYTRIYADTDGPGFNYYRTTAKNYTNTWVQNTNQICSGSGSILQWKNNYNPAYQALTDSNQCNDCTNFVSQALRSGGFPVGGPWQPVVGNYTWMVFDNQSNPPGLYYYLVTSLNAADEVGQSSLQIGDLGYTSSNHVVMVVGVNPLKYSGHTNDRKNRAWDSSLNHYLHILNYIP